MLMELNYGNELHYIKSVMLAYMNRIVLNKQKQMLMQLC